MIPESIVWLTPENRMLLLLLFGQTKGDDTVDLIKLLPEGTSVIAIIIIVVLFLRHQRDQMKDWKEAIASSNERLKQITDNFNLQIDKYTAEFITLKKEHQEQLQSLFDKFLVLSKDTVTNITELRGLIMQYYESRKPGPKGSS